jgi:hypothetical protein
MILSVSFFFKTQIGSDFDRLLSDRTDGIVEITILEHWYNTFRGYMTWSDTFYFYPYKGTLAFNDGYFLYGLPYSLFRLLGADPFLSSELVNVVLRIVAFAASQLFLRRSLGLGFSWSLLGAVVFTLSCNMAMRANHEQLLSVAFVPLFAWLVWNAVTSFAVGALKGFVLWASLAAVLMSAWLVTAYYMAWFTLFFLCFYSIISVLTNPRAAVRWMRGLSARSWISMGAVAAVSVIGILPFAMLYLPKAASTGMHPWSEVFQYLVHPLDVINVGSDNLLYGRVDELLNGYLRPDMPLFSEHTTGLTPLLVIVFGVACITLWIGRWTPRSRAIWLLATAAVVTWMITVRFGHWTLWREVFNFVPGAKAVRVVARYQLFLAAPVIAVVVTFLARQYTLAPSPLPAIIAVMLVTEQVTLAQPIALNRSAQMAWLQPIPPPPGECRSFFVSHARPWTDLSPDINAIYSHNTDAMFLAELFRLPTINGFSTFRPADWDFVGPERPDYADRVKTYVRAHGLEKVCALDLVKNQWDTNPLHLDQPGM